MCIKLMHDGNIDTEVEQHTPLIMATYLQRIFLQKQRIKTYLKTSTQILF